MKTIYMDMCCFNRPYDDQTQARIRLETEAKLLLQQLVKEGSCDLVWSAVLDFECDRNPYVEHRLAILQWRMLATRLVLSDQSVIAQSRQLAQHGIGHYDALHVASAVSGGAELFVTTDDRLMKRICKLGVMTAVLPAEALALVENWYED
ncbi:PIN domain-containing protein [Gammaproteobacteria bacterium]